MSILKEFKEFAVRGNAIDLAVGIIIGASFSKTVTSLVNDLLMPPIGKLIGGANFADLFISLDPEKTAGIRSLAQKRNRKTSFATNLQKALMPLSLPCIAI